MPQQERDELIRIKSDSIQMEGMLQLPQGPVGIVLFAHGSGSSRHSPRNNLVGRILREAGLGTLLLDLLVPAEEAQNEARFDIALLTGRLNSAVEWLQHYRDTCHLPIGIFGASTGAAAALQVAALRGNSIAAVVSRGGRPDLAGQRSLQNIESPTLLIVGELDDVVIRLNKAAYGMLHCAKKMEIVPGASHLFEEPGKLEIVASLARSWFSRHLARAMENPPARM